MPEKPGQRRRHVLRSGLFAQPGSIAQHEGVVALPADLLRVWKTLVDRPDVGKAAPGSDECERCPGPAAEEEEACVLQGRISTPLVGRVEAMEDHLTATGVVDHPVQRLDDDGRFDVTVVRQQRSDLPQRQRLVIASIVPGQQQAPMAGKRRVAQQIAQPVVDAQVHAFISRFNDAAAGLRGILGDASGIRFNVGTQRRERRCKHRPDRFHVVVSGAVQVLPR